MDLNFKYVSTEEGVLEALRYIETKKYIAIDTETTGLDPHSSKIHSIQIGDKQKQFVLDYVRTKPYLDRLAKMFLSDQIWWVGQNFKFDYKMLKSALGVAPKHTLDTMLAEQILTNGKNNISAALDAIAKKYINEEMQKDIRGSFADHSYGTMLNSVQQEYAAKDVATIIPILAAQRELLHRSGLIEVFELECKAIKPTAEMEYNGIFLDPDKWRALYKQSAKEAEEAKDKLDWYFEGHCPRDLFGDPIINYNSPAQLLPILKKITKVNIDSTSKAALEKLAEDHEVIKALLEYRVATKRHTTYGPEFLNNINKVTGRVHSNYTQLRSEQGRYASSGPNMQNIPAKPIFRECFRPEDILKTIMYTADYSGCELRILAELSEDRQFRKIFIDGLDPHKAVASILTGKAYDSITKDERKVYKSINFGVTYGMGPGKLSKQLDISIDYAKELINSYYTAFPGVKEFLDFVANQVEITHKAICPVDGRQRDMSAIDWDDPRMVSHARNVAKNMPFQGGNASMIKRAMATLYDKIESSGRDDLKLVACVHDEFVVEGDRSQTNSGKDLVVSSMVEAGEYYVKSVPMVVDVDVGDHWIKN